MSNLTARITSEKLYVEFLPEALVDTDIHVQHLYFDSAVTGGTFKLWVNGYQTAAIAFSATAATLIASINAALDALANLAAGEIVASGTDVTDITLTADGVGFYDIRIVAGYGETLTQTTPNCNNKLQTEVTTQGSQWFCLSGDMSSFNWEGTSNVVDVTGMAETAITEIPVSEAVSFDLSSYKVKHVVGNINMGIVLKNGRSGLMRVFPEGKLVNKTYHAMQILVESYAEDYPDHEKVELEMSGMRQGEWKVFPHTVITDVDAL